MRLSQLSYGRHVHVVVHLFTSSRNRFFLMLNTHLSYPTISIHAYENKNKKLRNVGKEVEKGRMKKVRKEQAHKT